MYKATTALLGLLFLSACPIQAGQQPSADEQEKVQRCLALSFAMGGENMESSMQAGKKFIDEACADLLKQYYDTEQVEKAQFVAAQWKAAKDTGLNNRFSKIVQELKNNSQ